MPKILSTALQTLREQAVLPRLVNGNYSSDAARRGAVIDVPVPSRMKAQDVQPGPYSQNVDDVQIDTIQIPLNNWKESAFALTDRDILEIMEGVPNMQIVEAARAIGNAVTESLYGLYAQVYNAVGTAGTTPFQNKALEATEARKFLNKWLAADRDRRIILDVDAEANALNLDVFQKDPFAQSTIVEGQIGRKFGFDWFYDQLTPYHNAGGLTGTLAVAYVGGEPYTVTAVPDANPLVRNNPRKIYTVRIDGITGGTVRRGDIFRVAGDAQTYVAMADATPSGGVVNVQFSPEPQVEWADNAVVTFSGSHAINLAFHRDAMALAVRSLQQEAFEEQLGGMTMTMQDPVTRIPLRLEVRREWKRVRWSLDCLWGCAVVRPEHIVRILG